MLNLHRTSLRLARRKLRQSLVVRIRVSDRARLLLNSCIHHYLLRGIGPRATFNELIAFQDIVVIGMPLAGELTLRVPVSSRGVVSGVLSRTPHLAIRFLLRPARPSQPDDVLVRSSTLLRNSLGAKS